MREPRKKFTSGPDMSFCVKHEHRDDPTIFEIFGTDKSFMWIRMKGVFREYEIDDVIAALTAIKNGEFPEED